MTVKVAGCWEHGWLAPITEYDLWAFPLRDFGVDEWYMAPVSGIEGRVTELRDVYEAIGLNPDLAPVYVDERGSVPLSVFEHPENTLYILGKAGFSPMRDGLSVRVETASNSGLLWPHQAICNVLYDRMIKWR